LVIRVDDVFQAHLNLPRKAGRSALYFWMMENRREFAEHVGGRPSWSALALAFGKFGLLDRNRKLPTGITCRQTWWRVRKDAARLHGGGKPESEALAVAEQPAELIGKRAKQRARDAARKADKMARANAWPMRKADPGVWPEGVRPAEPPAGVRVVETVADTADPSVQAQIDEVLRKMDDNPRWFILSPHRP
jgi:hypothetical protein